MSVEHAVSATLENYVEAIANLIARNGVARVRDIARALSVHKSTVTAALKVLSDKDLVNHAPYEAATLTPKGKKLAKEVVRRHKLIQRFLSEVLLVDDDAATANACRMEHVMDKEVLHRLSLFAEFVKECPRTGDDWLKKFGEYYRHNGHVQPDAAETERWLAGLKKRINKKKASERSEESMPTLDQLRAGQKAKIVRVGRGGAVGRRIVDMGVVRGTPVEVMKVAPLGDPIEVKVKGYNLSLRKEEAAAITVEPE